MRLASVLIAGGFTSAPAYLTEVQQEHVRRRYKWTNWRQQLDHDLRRALKRGQGQPVTAADISVGNHIMNAGLGGSSHGWGSAMGDAESASGSLVAPLC